MNHIGQFVKQQQMNFKKEQSREFKQQIERNQLKKLNYKKILNKIKRYKIISNTILHMLMDY